MTTLKLKLAELQKIARERTVKTQDIEYDLETLVKKIKNKVIRLDPEYQRRHRWTVETSSKLIESLLLNIPIPFIYISQDLDVDTESDDDVARYSVIDGQQRLTAIDRFMRGKFALKSLEVLSDLNGAYIKDLPPFLLRRLEERTVRCLRIDSTVDSQVKYDVFERLNSGSVKLESQELRNAVSRGPFNNLIKQLAEDVNFRTLLQVDLENPTENKKVQKMFDVELILRFFALRNEGYKELKGSFKTFLTSAMNTGNKLESDELLEFKRDFKATMEIALNAFGKRAFAKYHYDQIEADYQLASRFNAAVFDALSVAISDVAQGDASQISEDAPRKFKSLFVNPDFVEAVRGSVNDKAKTETRINMAKAVLA